jgi:cyclopropane fatty-acyl-phospholipid synthase-like methyltransferase
VRHAQVLEVGCGRGAWAIWAALHGASKIVGIEPDVEGSSDNSLEQFRRNIELLGLQERIEARGCTLQNLPGWEERFDVAVMYNVINHLDEDAVVSLHKNAEAVKRYVALLKKLRLHMRANGWVLVADCGRDNFYPQLGVRSPFMPTIEWHKHQNPATWVRVFAEAGFDLFDLRWSPLQPLSRLTANPVVQYFTCSHFVLRFRATTKSLSAGAAF